MNHQTTKNLEYVKIKEMIASYCSTASAKKAIFDMGFYLIEERCEESLDEISQAMGLISLMGSAPLYGYDEVEPYVVHAEKGGSIRNAGLLKIASALRAHEQLRRYVYHEGAAKEAFPLLESMAEDICPQVELEKEIDRKIVSEDDVADDASPALYDIRRQMRKAALDIKDRLSSMTQSAETRKLLQDPIVTMRQGRYVVPVKIENKSQVDGIVHDMSSSGLTIFIEPQAVVSLNNHLRELEGEEAREIDRILAELTAKVRAKADFIVRNEEILIILDKIFAKAKFAFEERHSRPIISRKKGFRLNKAFHPLIGYSKCVPSDIAIGESYSQIVITGPNTGGKTVLLKTIGLCALMAASGLYIPAGDGSAIAIFDDVFTDIGDEQSIEQSLSTFSSHIRRIVEILEKMGSNSLVLLDEIGAGTDPSEGAALAWAILDKIRGDGVISLATTHYSELKRYALLSEGTTNASMEFDSEKLQPTYRIHIGVPGKSNAFEISDRLGLDPKIIENASSLMSEGSHEFEDVIRKLEEKLSLASNAYEEARSEAAKAEDARKRIVSDLTQFRESRDKMMAQAAVEAKNVVTLARQTARGIISEAERFQSQASDISSRAARENVSQAASEALNEINKLIPEARPDKREKADGLSRISAGQIVYIPSLNAEGTILEPYGQDALVLVGAIKTRVPLSAMSQPKGGSGNGKTSFSNVKTQTVSPRLDIRGVTAAEAELEIDKYIDDAVLANLKTVTIIHGKGSGALKKAVHEFLSSHPSVERFRIGGLKEGGDGATIATLY